MDDFNQVFYVWFFFFISILSHISQRNAMEIIIINIYAVMCFSESLKHSEMCIALVLFFILITLSVIVDTRYKFVNPSENWLKRQNDIFHKFINDQSLSLPFCLPSVCSSGSALEEIQVRRVHRCLLRKPRCNP